MEKYQIYVQDINYPTVRRGEEKLRIVPTPFHTKEMCDEFVNAVVDVWHHLELPFTTKLEERNSLHRESKIAAVGSMALPEFATV